jgi:hypothetical protein
MLNNGERVWRQCCRTVRLFAVLPCHISKKGELMKKLVVIGTLALCLTFSSCATIMIGTSQEVSIASSPTGAQVLDNGVVLGKTPLAVDLKKKTRHQIRIELEGYAPYEVAMVRKTSGWIAGNIIFGGLIGLVVDAITGGMYMLKPEQIQAELIKMGAGYEHAKDTLIIAVVLEPDPSWQKIGQLKKEPN